MADPEQIRQVLINLITNAAESMPDGGEVRIGLSANCHDTESRMVVARVHDQGQGVAAEVQARIFEPFFTTKENGTGLGLCIAAQIMVRHGGRLTLESSTPQGSCFAVWIPAPDEDPHAENSDRGR
jgi:signal transduction histidine kinase